jgi:hypothetical protein
MQEYPPPPPLRSLPSDNSRLLLAGGNYTRQIFIRRLYWHHQFATRKIYNILINYFHCLLAVIQLVIRYSIYSCICAIQHNEIPIFTFYRVRTGSPVRISKTFQSPLTQISKTTHSAILKPNSWIWNIQHSFTNAKQYGSRQWHTTVL